MSIHVAARTPGQSAAMMFHFWNGIKMPAFFSIIAMEKKFNKIILPDLRFFTYITNLSGGGASVVGEYNFLMGRQAECPGLFDSIIAEIPSAIHAGTR